MATTPNTYISMANLTRYDGNMKTYISSEKTNSLKAVEVKNNQINFYVNPAPTKDTIPDFTVDFPVEYFLDQARSVLVQNFVWAEEIYPGSTNPNFDGKPVLVLAVKGDNNTVTYSFLNLENLIKIYENGESNSVSVVIDKDTNTISANVKISNAEGNILSIREDGLYAESVFDISGKADKVKEAEVKIGQILVDNGEGNIAASGQTVAELTDEILAKFVPMTDEEVDALFVEEDESV